jgi:hypothetical protein
MADMSGRIEPDDGVSVTERSRGYSSSAGGPADDTSAHTENPTTPIEWRRDEEKRAPTHPNADLPDLRRSLRTADEVERDRPRHTPGWVPIAVAVAVFVVVVAAGGAAITVVVAQQRDVPPPAAPAPLEELEGVPVRKGLNTD